MNMWTHGTNYYSIEQSEIWLNLMPDLLFEHISDEFLKL